MANLREKIHHLDDMLKSQQRKVRQMIEQVGDSLTLKCTMLHALFPVAHLQNQGAPPGIELQERQNRPKETGLYLFTCSLQDSLPQGVVMLSD